MTVLWLSERSEDHLAQRSVISACRRLFHPTFHFYFDLPPLRSSIEISMWGCRSYHCFLEGVFTVAFCRRKKSLISPPGPRSCVLCVRSFEQHPRRARARRVLLQRRPAQSRHRVQYSPTPHFVSFCLFSVSLSGGGACGSYNPAQRSMC